MNRPNASSSVHVEMLFLCAMYVRMLLYDRISKNESQPI